MDKLKKTAMAALLCSLAPLSCTKNLQVEKHEGQIPMHVGEKTELTVELLPAGAESATKSMTVTGGFGSVPNDKATSCMPGTKATTDLQDGVISSIQVFVFRGGSGDDAGQIEATSEISTGNSVTLNCLSGEKNIYAIANGPEMSVLNEAELKAKVSSLAENSASGFVMAGTLKAENLTAGKESISIQVTRIAAKIEVGKIVADFREKTYRDLANAGKFKITGMYIINVASKGYYDGREYSPQTYLHNGKYVAGGIDALAYDNVNFSFGTDNLTYNQEHRFYCYPNSSLSSKTRLVIQAQLNSKTLYYPITFDSISPNTLYKIGQITIKNVGTTSPDTYLSSDDFTFNITVKPWETVFLPNEVI